MRGHSRVRWREGGRDREGGREGGRDVTAGGGREEVGCVGLKGTQGEVTAGGGVGCLRLKGRSLQEGV